MSIEHFSFNHFNSDRSQRSSKRKLMNVLIKKELSVQKRSINLSYPRFEGSVMAVKMGLFLSVFLCLITCNYSNALDSTLNKRWNVSAVNITQGRETDYKKNKRAWDIGITVGFTISAIMSLTGNSMVMHVVRTTPSMHTSVNFYIANMALSDIISTVFCIPISLQSLFNFDSWLQGTIGLILCKLVYILFYTSFACSTFSLVVVAFDRYLAVSKPFYRYSTRNVTLIILVIWITSTTLSMPIAAAYTNKYKPLRDEEYTICLDLERDKVYVVGVTIMTLLCYVFPLAVASTFYLLTGCKLCTRSRMSIATRSERTKERARRSAIKATKLMVTVITIFAFCWAPFVIYHMGKAWYDRNLNEELQWFYRPLCFLFASTIGAINPCLYVSFSENFRSGFKSILAYNNNRVQNINRPRQLQINPIPVARKLTYP